MARLSQANLVFKSNIFLYYRKYRMILRIKLLPHHKQDAFKVISFKKVRLAFSVGIILIQKKETNVVLYAVCRTILYQFFKSAGNI